MGRMIQKLPALAALALSSCYVAGTRAPDRVGPYGHGERAREGVPPVSPYEYAAEPREDVPPAAVAVRPYEYGEEIAPAGRSFGYLTVGWLAMADYRGDIDLESGSGWRVSVPPLAALSLSWDVFWFLGIIACAAEGGGISGDVDQIFIDLDSPAVWTSGLSGDRPLLSEVSWELTFERSDHGPDDTFRVLAGLRIGASRRTQLRPYGCGGWSWHWLWLKGLDDVRANGPYAGGGFDFFLSPGSSVGLDGRWHWVRAEGYDATRLLTIELSWSMHW